MNELANLKSLNLRAGVSPTDDLDKNRVSARYQLSQDTVSDDAFADQDSIAATVRSKALHVCKSS